MDGIVDAEAQLPSRAVLIRSHAGLLTVQGAGDGTQVSVCTADGALVGSAISQNGQVQIHTGLRPGAVAIVSVGQKSVKTMVK